MVLHNFLILSASALTVAAFYALGKGVALGMRWIGDRSGMTTTGRRHVDRVAAARSPLSQDTDTIRFDWSWPK